MKKTSILLLCLFLVGCQNKIIDDSSKAVEDSSSILSSESQTSSSSSIQESEESSSNIEENRVVNFESINIGVNEKYHLLSMFNEEYQTALIDYSIENSEVLGIDRYDHIIGKSIGTSKLTILIDYEEYQTIQVNVLDSKEAFLDMHFDLGNLYNKNITIFGDSISDNSTTAYSDNRPTFWVEMLENYNVGTIYNHAKSGATVGYSVSMEKVGALDIVSTNIVNNSQTKKDLIASDYAFILIGTNDFFRQVTIGESGDVTDENYKTKESFNGSYSYLIKKIYEANPDIKIVCLSTTSSTWGLDACTNYSNRANCYQTRAKMNEGIKKIAADNDAMYIDLYGLWEDFNTYCPDGIHPSTKGYQLMIDTIMNHNK